MKSTYIFIASAFLLSGCSAAPNTSDSIQPEPSDSATSEEIEVDQGLLTVDITYPASFVNMGGEEYTQEKLDEAIAKEGYLGGKLNEDGSVTFTMTKLQHSEMMDEAKRGFDESTKELLAEYPNITAITRNDNFTEIRIETTDNDFTLGFLGLSLSFQAYFFHILNGSEFTLDVITVSSETGEELDRTTYPLDQ